MFVPFFVVGLAGLEPPTYALYSHALVAFARTSLGWQGGGRLSYIPINNKY